MAEVPIQISGMLYDLLNKTTQRVVLMGNASIIGLSVGGGPIIPPDSTPPPGGGAELPETSDSGENSTDEVTLTRAELDALVDEAVRKDRARR